MNYERSGAVSSPYSEETSGGLFWKSKLLRYYRYIRARELRKALKQWCIMHKRSFEARLEFQINLFKAVLVYKDEVKDYIGGNLRFKCDGSRNELKTLYRYIYFVSMMGINL